MPTMTIPRVVRLSHIFHFCLKSPSWSVTSFIAADIEENIKLLVLPEVKKFFIAADIEQEIFKLLVLPEGNRISGKLTGKFNKQKLKNI